ncbi:MAG TPA: alkaline phosphatase family protein [Thermoanaerobaculia bacterium]|nr:alkaline phosphatase family protein [Thermoanaerobaculia bacterium]
MRILLLAVFAGCASVPPPAAPPPDPPPASVVFISFDGVAWDELESVRARGVLGADGWQRIRREGLASRLIPVNPTLTSVTHVSMATGASPHVTGIVSNVIHPPGTPPGTTTSGFTAPIEADTIWEAARRAGRRVGTITYPGLDGTDPSRTADFGLIYTQPVHRSRIETIDRSRFVPEPRIEALSYSPAQVAALSWSWTRSDDEISMPVELVAIDTTDDGEVNYDDFVVRHGGELVEVGPDRWFPLSVGMPEEGSEHRFGAWSKILSFEPDLESVVVYWGAVCRTRGYPESFRAMIDRDVGFWPGPPDDWGAGRWLEAREGLDPETYLEQVDRFSSFFTRATLLAMERMEFDLLLSYQPIVDETEHQWHLVNDRQTWSTEANRVTARRVRDGAYRIFDGALARTIEAIGPGETLVVVSDHGMAALDTAVRINGVLVDWGFARAAANGGIDPNSRWAAFTSGGAAHFHRFGPRVEGERERLIRSLTELRSPDGVPLFERVEPAGPASNPRAGEIEAYLRPRFGFTSGTRGERFVPTRYFGQHGYLNHHPEMHAIFGVWGQAAAGQSPAATSQTALAGWISSILGFEPPRDAE